jgi:hypothetical protein
MANDVGTWSGVRREMEDSWELVRVLRSGTRAMRAAGGKFTPATKKEAKTRDRYAQRLARTVLFPIYDRTVRKLASLPFMKPPTISGELPEPLDRLLSNADRQGTSLSSFAQMIYEDSIDRGLGLFLVDNVPTVGLTLPEADAMDARPYFRRVHPDNLVGCRTRMRNGVEEVVELRIRNWYYESSPVGGGDVLADMVERWTPERVERWYRSGSEHDPDREQNATLTQGNREKDSRIAELETKLRAAAGRKVTLDLKVDPQLLGGLKVKVGSRLVDASLQGQLKRLHLALAGRA